MRRMQTPPRLLLCVIACAVIATLTTVAVLSLVGDLGSTSSLRAPARTVATGDHSATARRAEEDSDKPQCEEAEVVYPSWPAKFKPNVSAVFIIGEQKSGTTWLWHMLNAHPCLLSAAQPNWRFDGITTKETYYFTKYSLNPDARELLIPWMGFSKDIALTDAAIRKIGPDWLERAQEAATEHTVASAGARVFTVPPTKLKGFREECPKTYILEATPHNLHTPIAAARVKQLFPEAKLIASLKDPVDRFKSAYNQFGKRFVENCNKVKPAEWCPIFKYFRLQLPTYAKAVRDEIAHLRAEGCAFQEAQNVRSWMDCFGCKVMDPWKGQGMLTPAGYTPAAALGMYAHMLEGWLRFFPSSAFRLINYQQLADQPMAMVNDVLRFLELEEYTTEQFQSLDAGRLGFKGVYNQPGNVTADKIATQELAEFYRPLNMRLYKLCRQHGIQWQPFASRTYQH